MASPYIFYCILFMKGGNYSFIQAILIIIEKKLFKSMVQQDLSFFDLNDVKYISEENIYDGKHNKDDDNFDKDNKDNSLGSNFKESNLILNSIIRTISEMIGIVASIISSYTIVYLYHNKMSLVLLIFVPFLFIGLYCHMKIYNSNNSERRKMHAESSKIAINILSNMEIVYDLGIEKYVCELYENEFNAYLKSLKTRNFIYSIFSSIFDNLGIIIFLVGFYFGFQLFKENKIDILHLFVVILITVFSSSAAKHYHLILELFNMSIISYNGIFSIIDRKPKIDPSSSNGIRDVSLNSKITLDTIKFSYSTNPSSPIINMEKAKGKGEDNSNSGIKIEKIEIPEGKKIVIVGSKGSGKTTLLKLILRLYDVNQGAILLDDIKSTDYNVKWLRQKISIVE